MKIRKIKINPAHVCFGLLALFASGCSTVKVGQPAGEFTPQATAVERSGVKLTIQPVLDPLQVQNQFGGNLLKQGILPVYVAARNDGSATVLMEQFRVQGLFSDGKASNEISYRSKNGAAMETAGVLFFTPLLIAGISQMSDAATVTHNVVRQQLLNQTLSPGEAVSGFIYFAQKGEIKTGTPVTVTIESRDLANDQTTEFSNQ